MFLCLSSGARERYRRDIILALAMPEGSLLQFRYNREWVAESVIGKILSKKARSVRALICYVDQFNKDQLPQSVPCRFAHIADADMHGTTVAIRFALDEFAYADDLASFNSQLRRSLPDPLPTVGEDTRIGGYYCLDMCANVPTSVVSTRELSNWERIVAQLAPRPDFANEKLFYTLERVRSIPGEKKIVLRGHRFRLKPSQRYEIDIYHFHPTQGRSDAFLRLETQSDLIRFTSSPVLRVDSRYDVKHVRFETRQPTTSGAHVLSIFRGDDADTNKLGDFDFDVEMDISGSWVSRLIIGITIGVLLAASNVVAAISSTSLSTGAKTAIVIVAILAGLAAGLVASFGLKKYV